MIPDVLLLIPKPSKSKIGSATSKSKRIVIWGACNMIEFIVKRLENLILRRSTDKKIATYKFIDGLHMV